MTTSRRKCAPLQNVHLKWLSWLTGAFRTTRLQRTREKVEALPQSRFEWVLSMWDAGCALLLLSSSQEMNLNETRQTKTNDRYKHHKSVKLFYIVAFFALLIVHRILGKLLYKYENYCLSGSTDGHISLRRVAAALEMMSHVPDMLLSPRTKSHCCKRSLKDLCDVREINENIS